MRQNNYDLMDKPAYIQRENKKPEIIQREFQYARISIRGFVCWLECTSHQHNEQNQSSRDSRRSVWLDSLLSWKCLSQKTMIEFLEARMPSQIGWKGEVLSTNLPRQRRIRCATRNSLLCPRSLMCHLKSSYGMECLTPLRFIWVR